MRTCNALLTVAVFAILSAAACAEPASSAPAKAPSAESAGSAVSAAPAAPAAGAPGRGAPGSGWQHQDAYGRLYDTATVTTIRGEVLRVERVTPMQGMSSGVHAVVRGDDGATLSIHLGPSWFIDQQELALQPGDRVEITGSRVTFDGAPALIARTVVKGEDVLVLRDEAGFPMWSAVRRRGR